MGCWSWNLEASIGMGHLKENNIWGWHDHVYILESCIWQHGEGWSALLAQVKRIPLIKSQFLLTTSGNLPGFPQTGSGTSPLCVLSHFSRVRLCNPMDCSPPGFSVQGIFQARILEQVAISFSRGSSSPKIEPASPTLASGFFTTEPPGKPTVFPYLILNSGQWCPEEGRTSSQMI